MKKIDRIKELIKKHIRVERSPLKFTIVIITFGRLRANFYIYPKKEVLK